VPRPRGSYNSRITSKPSGGESIPSRNANGARLALGLVRPGGAPNPHRVDWEPLKRLSPRIKVVVVCDHDPPGENAISHISFSLQRRMGALRFGDDFPRKFDLSDPFLETLYEEKNGERILKRGAPTLEDCIEPATWATMADHKLRAEFIEEWLYSVQPEFFFNRANFSRRYREAEFNALIAPFCHQHLANVAALLRRCNSAQAGTVIYEPGRKSGRISFEGQQAINVYQPSSIQPQAGDEKLWLEFIEYLVPDPKDRKEMLRWCATLIARPDVRIKYSVLAISQTQGVGKTTLADILSKLVGRSNCSFPSAETVTDSTFSSWIAFKRLAVIAEIYSGHSSKAYNKFKAKITDDDVDVNEKYVKEFTIRNWIHVFATSNSFRALKLDDQDRRWFVPGITEERKDREYFRAFRAWLDDEGGLSIIAYWAQQYVKEKGEPGADRRTCPEFGSQGT
jgi:hypothetical protein